MVEPIYVPVLPARRSALAAYERLAPWARRKTSPLWTIPPRTGAERTMGHRPSAPPDRDPVALTHYVRTKMVGITNVQQAIPAWLDAFHVEDEPGPLSAGIWELLADGPLRPVTGIERAHWQQLACAEWARTSGNGLGIRILVTSPPDERCADAVRCLLDRIGPSTPAVDLLLDLRAVTDEHHPADKWALRALDLLDPLHGWRTVVLMAGSFPRHLPESAGAVMEDAHRFDWDTWHMVRHARGEHASHVIYGDYGAHHTGSADQPSERGGGPPWGVLRYTTERTFLLVRAPAEGPNRSATVRSLARRLVEVHDFRDRAFSDGERWLRDCAYGVGSDGAGTPEIWTRAGHVQHMTYVVRSLT
ncbi:MULTISPECIES: beta family protein [Streptomyces]|uniref:beta family protein n=1 Tax=Streptomyces TaxID=1883 RepID=UPI001E44B1AB|nr:beta family protein [Streptomyces sp. 8ZJF_21]MCC4321498.1 beta family protein [Streptomyces malaysiensis]MCD9593963.1 beta family protein [Streptomyces sp. 8ZJF_21]